MHTNPDLFLNSVASEVWEPARKILAFMQRYNEGFAIHPPREIPALQA